MKLRTSAALLLMMLAPSVRAAAPDMSKWSHVAPLQVAGTLEKGLVEFPVPPDVIAVARQDLADLRLIGKSGEVVPYVLRTDTGAPGRSVPYTARLFNPVFLPGKESSVSVDFGASARRTRIDIETAGTNFRRRVRVEASPDGSTWAVLKASDWLFRINFEGGSYNKAEVILPDNDFRYLRVTVYNAPDDPVQVPVRNVTAWNIQATAPQTVEVPTRAVTVKQDIKAKVTEIEADLGYENLPLYEIAAAFDDPNFLRRVELFGRNVRTRTVVEPVENSPPRTREVEEPWSAIFTGSFYRLPGGDGLEPSTGLTLRPEAQCRYLLLRIYNGDDAPLKFTGLKVRRLQQYVAFRADAAGPLLLYFGNAEGQAPQYDLINFAERLRSEGVSAATLGPAAPNPQFAVKTKAVPWTEQHAVLLWSSLVAVMAVLLALVLRQMKQAKSAGSATPQART